jgi:hypothetical protein
MGASLLNLQLKKGGYVKNLCSKVVYVKDITKPYISCSGSITVECDGDVPPPNPYSVTAYVNCGKVYVKWVRDVSYGTCPKVITRTYKATLNVAIIVPVHRQLL